MKKLMLPLVLVTALFSETSNAETYEAYGVGSKASCGSWTEEMRNDKDSIRGFILRAWVQGFVSGYGYARGNLKRVDNPAMFGFINNYCAANPLDSVADAAEALVAKMKE